MSFAALLDREDGGVDDVREPQSSSASVAAVDRHRGGSISGSRRSLLASSRSLASSPAARAPRLSASAGASGAGGGAGGGGGGADSRLIAMGGDNSAPFDGIGGETGGDGVSGEARGPRRRSIEHGMPLLQGYRQVHSKLRKDFTTVDWYFSKFKLAEEEQQVRQFNKEHRGCRGKIANILIAGQAWFILALCAMATAFTGSFIHTSAEWLSQSKSGYCQGHGFWVSREICCLESKGTSCEEWTYWYEALGASGAGGWWLGYFIYVSMGVGTAALASWLCTVYSLKAAGSGIPQVKVILGGFIIKKFLGIRTMLVKSIGLVLAVGSGLNLGKEGPLVHIACAWGNILSRYFSKYAHNEVKKREILSAAAAAGVAVAFGAPLGGVLFSLESVSLFFPPKTMWRSFFCAVAATLVVSWLDPFQTGDIVQFNIKYTIDWNWFEMVPFAVLGVCGGLMGALYVRWNTKLFQMRRMYSWWRNHPILEVAIVALITGLANYANVYTRGSGTTLLQGLFGSCSEFHLQHGENGDTAGSDPVILALCGKESESSAGIGLLIVAGLAKFVLSIFTFGTLIPSGQFIPAFAAGACLGRVFGWSFESWHHSVGDQFIFAVCAGKSNCIQPGLYAICGAAAVLGGITRMTVSLAVIMFELTGGLDTVIPVMISIVVAKWVADAFGKKGAFSAVIELQGYPHVDPNMEMNQSAGTAADIVGQVGHPISLSAYGQSVQSLIDILDAHPYHVFPVVESSHDQTVVGVVSRIDLRNALAEELGQMDDEDSQGFGDLGDAFQLHETKRDGEIDPEMQRVLVRRVHFSKNVPPFAFSANHIDLSHIVDAFPVSVHPACPAARVLDLFKSLGVRYVVIANQNGTLVGLMKRKDLLHYLHLPDAF